MYIEVREEEKQEEVEVIVSPSLEEGGSLRSDYKEAVLEE